METEGYLQKRKKGNHRWQKRYFLLKGTYFAYFQSAEAYNKDPSAPSKEFKITQDCQFSDTKTGTQFWLTFPECTYEFYASTTTEYDTWAKALTSVIEREGRREQVPEVQRNEDNTLKAFGNQLATFGSGTPEFVRSWYTFIEKYGLGVEGLFRKPGETLVIEQMKDWQNKNCSICEDIEKKYGTNEATVHAIASLLKSFFREIPGSLIGIEAVNFLLESSSSADSEELQHIKIAFTMPYLSAVNSTVLFDLLRFLHKVALQQDRNCMSADNLAICWAPSLFMMDMSNIKPLTRILQIAIESVEKFAVNSQSNATTPPSPPHARPKEDDENEKLNRLLAEKGWIKKLSSDGREFYYNREEKRSSWSADGLVERWIKVHTKDGKPYYYHSVTLERKWKL